MVLDIGFPARERNTQFFNDRHLSLQLIKKLRYFLLQLLFLERNGLHLGL